ncbi:selenium cofactor biosynthesis protein YqeC [Treponema vincentii]|uniref:selenium cofactor biosynthesis protein YqeC n=1 Tax=Treponema vincentii TaxID=69710 RepID=UPI0003A915AB|nr:selenium cofactor biosynthesis protein YqeC [Treponema vincentii]
MPARINQINRIRSFNYRRKRSLTEKLHIGRGDAVSFIGSGGKTTSVITAANELASQGLRVAVTTTTKMGVHEKERLNSSVSFFGTVTGQKLSAPPLEVIDRLCNSFDVVLIEADGSKRRAVKGWNDTEPVIHPRTTKTVGLISTRTLGKPVNEIWVHRPERFLSITSAKMDKPLRLTHIMQAVFHPSGLFLRARGTCFVLCIAPRSEHEAIRTAYYRARGRRFGQRGTRSNPYLRFSCPCTGNRKPFRHPPYCSVQRGCKARALHDRRN